MKLKGNPVDTTAAGDSFTAALALALGEGKEYGEAIQFGNVVSRIVVTRKGSTDFHTHNGRGDRNYEGGEGE